MKNTILLLFLIVLACACAKDADLTTDKANFTRVYDNDKFDASYYPIDIKETSDGGFLILGGRKLTDSNFSGAYLMKVDELGMFVSELEVPSDKVAPIGPWLEVNNKFYFFAMTAIGLKTELHEVDADGALTKTTQVVGDGGGGYPAAAYNDNGRFLLLRYDNIRKESVVDVVNTAGVTSSFIGFSVGRGDAVEAPIIEHFLRTGKQFPFQVGKTSSGLYFFNGFYNYTFSLVFTDLVSDQPGVVQGQQDDGGFSAVMPISGNNFAAARFNFGDNYLLPSVTLNPSDISSSVDLGGNNLPELSSNAPVRIISATINGKDISLYGSNTRSKQISLYGYEKNTGKFLGSRYLGFSNPFEIAAMTTTKDGGLVVCGTTYVAGRFPRICLFKISAEELAKSFK
ncbi:MAG: hypothetical protein ACK5RG_00430 [Cyclobacteriaceae bacterium]|jgi:hypothetical protein|nr:hypothetical protein [Flammeovirgaceae bacterium]